MNSDSVCPPALQLSPDDNVAIAARRLAAGSEIRLEGDRLRLLQEIRPGHKMARRDIRKGEAILKYGQVIGHASEEIPAGSWIHVHNCAAHRFERSYAISSEVPPPPHREETRTFEGYLRPNGKAGTRNYVAVVSTVNCSASTSRFVADRIRSEGLRDYPHVDGVLPIVHKAGCAMQHGGPDHLQLERVLAGFARHSNVAGCLLLGLGCETGEASHLIQAKNLVDLEGVPKNEADQPPPVILIQEAGGIQKTVEAAVRALRRLLSRANTLRRTSIPASELILGTQCGGSDGQSGITANPALGFAADLLVAQGGTVVLGETPEIYGAEHLLTRRAISQEIGEKLLDRIRWWEWYTSVFGAEINNNPTPGNKEGGITTIYEKSLGALAKGGKTALMDVYQYAEPIAAKGLVVMDTPGYDPVSLTGIVAGGANICAFTTGRGSVYGCKPSPSIKIATNTLLFERMGEDMDLDAGTILAGIPLEDVGRRIFEEILAVASGKKTKSELAGVGEEEFSPWTIGPVL